MRWRCMLLMMILLTALATGRPAAADSAPLASVGPGVQPMASTTTRMESERIEIRVRRFARDPADFGWEGMADYRIQFHFVPAADESITAGFPLFVYDGQQAIYGAPLQDFKVLAGGQPVVTEVKGGVEHYVETRWATFPLQFRKGEPLDLEVSYSLEAQPYGKGVSSDLWIAYVLRTGAFWAGTIGKAEATVQMDKPIRREDVRAESRVRGTTPGWTLTNGALHWEWQNVEPDFDLSVQMANSYWLDTASDIQALLSGARSDRDTLLRITTGTTALFEGDARAGVWLPVRGGETSEKAGERILPDVLRLLREQMQKEPQEGELRERYFRLLFYSAWHVDMQGWTLYNEERFRSWLAEARQSRQDGAPSAPGLDNLPWSRAPIPGVKLEEATQKALAAFVGDLMPNTFGSEATARSWVDTSTGHTLADAQAQPLLEAALRRVRPPEPTPTPAFPDPAPSAPPAPAPSPAPAPAPLAHDWWPAAGGLGALLLITGGVLWWRRLRIRQ